MSDGPNGVRGDSTSGKSSACFPCAISLSSSWDLELIKEIGIALGEEAKAKDVDVLLGPTINIHRHPLGGRHFESFSEDPFLTGRIATNYVQGVQSKNVAACVKHFVGNDTEFERHAVSSNIDEQTLREIYLLPFEMAVKIINRILYPDTVEPTRSSFPLPSRSGAYLDRCLSRASAFAARGATSKRN